MINENEPSENVKKLTKELVNNLNEVVICFGKLNQNMYDMDDILNSILNSCLAFAGITIQMLSKELPDPLEVKNEATIVFIKYMNKIK